MMADAVRNRLNSLDGQQRRFALEALARHLIAAGQFDRLDRLFVDDRWMAVRFEGSSGVYDGFLNDLTVAWTAAADPHERSADFAGHRRVSDCVHYALIRTSINTIAGSCAPEVVVRALEAGIWSADVALSRASSTTAPKGRAALYASMLVKGLVPSGRYRQAVTAGLDAALAAQTEPDRAQAIERLAPFVDGESVARAMDAGRRMKGAPRVKVLTALLPRLDGAARADAVAGACETALSPGEPPDFESVLLLALGGHIESGHTWTLQNRP